MSRWIRIWLALSGVNGFMAVAAGAFGAHAVTDPKVQSLLRIGSQYQAAHAIAALACLGLAATFGAQIRWAAGLFGLGGLVFAGSLYMLAMTDVRPWGAVTPVGGLLLLAGWACVMWTAIRPARLDSAPSSPPPTC